jgi:hypothetical protein
MAPNFSHLLKRPAGKAKKPEALPAGLYPGVIKSVEYGDQNKNKTPYVRCHLGLTGWPEDISEDDKAPGGEPVDLAKRQPRRDYYLTDDALWRLDELLRSMGIEPSGRSYEEVIPDAVGQSVTVEMQQYLNEKNNETGNQVGKLFAQA